MYLGEEIEKDLVQLLQKKLDEAVLEQVWFMFERNKMCKLTQDDVAVILFPLRFIQGCHGTGKTGNLKVHFSRQGKHWEFAKKY